MAEYSNDYGLDYSSPVNENTNSTLGLDYSTDTVPDDKYAKLERSAELKRKRMYRQDELQYNDDGTLINDSNSMIRAKTAANATIKGIDWLLEASENAVDFGQGDWISHYTGFKAENQGRTYDMGNKDFIAARNTTTDQLIADYQNATHNPNADKGVYTLKKFDGYDDAGSEKFLYKYGIADVGADTRYRDQYVQDGFEIVEEKRFAGAEDWERTWNASEDVLAARTLGQSSEMIKDAEGNYISRDEASGINFGDGKSELLNRDVLGVDVGKTQADYDTNRRYSEALSTERDAEGWHDNSVWGRTKNTISGASSMLTKTLIVDTVDWIAELAGGEGVGTEEEKRKFTQDMFNYDESFSKENMAEIEGHVGDMMRDGLSWKGIKGALGSAIANVETTGESLGYLAGLFVGFGKFTAVGKANKVLKTAQAAKAAGVAGATENVARLEKIVKGASVGQKATYHIASQAGLLNATSGMTNDHIDAFTENNNGIGPSGSQITFMFLNNLAAIGSDKLVDFHILKQAGVIGTLKESIKSVAKDKLPNIAQKIGETAIVLATNMGKEFGQEYYQTMSEQVNKQWGTDKYGNSLMQVLGDDENILESLVGGVAGAGGAVHFQLAVEASKAARAGTGKLADKKVAKDAKIAENIAVDLGIDGETDVDIDSKIDALVPLASQNEDGTYNNASVKEEYSGLIDGLIKGYSTKLEQAETAGSDMTKQPLGSAKALIKRAWESFDKINVNNATEDDIKIANQYVDDLRVFEEKIDNMFLRTYETLEIEDINNMSVENLQKIYHAQNEKASSSSYPSNAEKIIRKNAKRVKDKSSNTTSEASLKDIENLVAEIEKSAVIERKLGNTNTADILDKRAKNIKDGKITAEDIFQDKIFKDKKGIAPKAAQVVIDQLAVKELESERATEYARTEAWIKDNMPNSTGVTVEAFLEPSAEEYAAYKTNYYFDLNKNDAIRSLHDIDRNIGQIDTRKKSFLDEVKSLRDNAVQRKKNILNHTIDMAERINLEIDDYINNGIPSEPTEDMIPGVGEANINRTSKAVTKDEAIAALKKEYDTSNKKNVESVVGSEDLKIHKNSVLEAMTNKNNKDSSPTGIMELISKIDKEIASIDQIAIDGNGIVTLEPVLSAEVTKNEAKIEKQKEETEEKEIKKAEKKAEKIIGKKVKLSSKKELKLNRKEIAKLENRVLEVNRKIREHLVNKGGDNLTKVQENIIGDIKDIDSVIQNSFEGYFDIQNRLKKLGQEDYKNKKRLEEIESDLQSLHDERLYLIDELEKPESKVKGKKEFENLTFDEKAMKVMRGIAAKALGILSSLKKKILIPLFNINKDIESLEKEKVNIEKERAITLDERNDLIDERQPLEDNLQEKLDYNTDLGFKNVKEVDDKVVTDTAILKDRRDKHARLVKLINNKIKRIKAKIEVPNETLKMFGNQEQNVELYKDENYQKLKNKIPLVLSEYATTGAKAKSLLSVMTPKMIQRDRLTKYSKKASKFLKNSGLLNYIETPALRKYIVETSTAMTMLTDADGKINESFITAIILAAEKVVRNSSSSMVYKNESDTERMIGITEGSINPEQMSAFSPLTRRSVLANDIAKEALAMLDIQELKTGSTEAFGRFKASVGLIGVLYLTTGKEPVLIESTMDRKVYNELVDKNQEESENESEKDKSKVQFLARPYTDESETLREPFDQDYILELKDDFEKLEKSSIIPESLSGAKFRKVKIKTVDEEKISKNPYMTVTKVINEGLNNSREQEHNLLMNSVNTMLEIGRKKSLKLMGHIPLKEINSNKNTGLATKESQIAANMEKERAYDELVFLEKMIKSGLYPNTIWFDYFTAKSNRIFIKSVLIDPQTEKEGHRWVVTPTNSIKEYSTNLIDSDDESQIGFKYGIAQAFGHGIDKSSRKNDKEITIIKDGKEIVDEVISTISYANQLLEMNRFTLMAKILNKEFDHFGHGVQAYHAILDYQAAKKEAKAKGKVVNGKLYEKPTRFKTTVTTEYDGLSNGIILKTLQMMVGSNYKGILYKGGLVAKGVDNELGEYQSGTNFDEFLSMAEDISDSLTARDDIKNESKGKVLDVYYTQSTIAKLDFQSIKSRIDAIDKATEENASGSDYESLDKYGLLEDERIMLFMPNVENALTKELRELFKDPTITTGYGSSINTVINNIAKNTTETGINSLLEAYNDDKNVNHKQALAIIESIRKYHGIKKKDLITAIQTKNLNSIGVKDDNLENNIIEIMKVAIGDAVGDAVKETFGEQIEATTKVNEASRMMHKVFEQALTQEIDKIVKYNEKAKDKDKIILSSEKMVEIVKKIKKFMPIFDGPGSTERLEDGTAIFDSGLMDDSDLEYPDAKADIAWVPKDENGKDILNDKGYATQKSMNSRTFITKIMEAFSAAGVIPTHTEDGYNMAQTINKFMKEYGVTSVHDAIILAGLNPSEVLQFYNKTMLETTKNFSFMNSVATTMRSVMEAAENQNEYKIDLNDMRATDEKGREVWVYDKISTDTAYSNSSGGIM